MNSIFEFFIANIPSWRAIVIGGPLGLAWSLSALWFAGRLKQIGVRTGYTRKVFHFLIFCTVAILQWRYGTPAVCLFGGMCTLAIFLALWQGPGNMLYEAMAREKDDPHRTYFILIPYFTTLVGGLASNILFGPIAVAGYLVAGLGDAIGEPAGTLLGRHHYRVWSRSSVPSTRSVEGSIAVFVMSTVALAMATSMTPAISLMHYGVLKLITIAGASAVAEAISPHGWDNATMQILPTALVWLWMT